MLSKRGSWNTAACLTYIALETDSLDISVYICMLSVFCLNRLTEVDDQQHPILLKTDGNECWSTLKA